MLTDEEQKKGTLRLDRSDRPAIERRTRGPASYTTGQVRLDMVMAPLFQAVRGADGTRPSRRWQKASDEELHPLRYFARFVMDGIKARVHRRALLAFARELEDWINDECDRAGIPPLETDEAYRTRAA